MSPLDLVCVSCGALPQAPCVGIAPATHPMRAVSGQPRPDDAVADLEAALVRVGRELVLERRRADELADAVTVHLAVSHQVLQQWASTVALAQRALLALERVQRADSLCEARDAAADALDEVEPTRPARA